MTGRVTAAVQQPAQEQPAVRDFQHPRVVIIVGEHHHGHPHVATGAQIAFAYRSRAMLERALAAHQAQQAQTPAPLNVNVAGQGREEGKEITVDELLKTLWPFAKADWGRQ